ncbi:MAG TPA: N-acetyl-gamma-glutamyl-phosphate reductase [Actinomycetota bacterium]|nr:N-acetyl-gamma-glutamyl-phosphate reductase [Actinomycetota bacterium]
MQKYAVAVLGASGYSGAELLRLLAGHSQLEATFLGAHDAAGSLVGEVFPHLAPFAHRRYEPLDALDLSSVQAAFLALPAGMSSTIAPRLVEGGLRVVDLAGDFRLPASAYPEWYGFSHPAPAWLDRAVYGLPELFRKEVAEASLVANPGCYPTPVLLGLAPLLSAGLVEPHAIVVDGKSGISGAGKKPTHRSHFAALDGSVQAYRVGRHQHTPEMEHGLALATGTRATVTFVPHLVPAVRGVVTTAYARLAEGSSLADLREALTQAYAGEPFVRVVPQGEVPDPKRVAGTNVCELGVGVDAHARTAVVMGALDNLGKGAAGQALQNLNLMLGLEETLGLPTVGVYP